MSQLFINNAKTILDGSIAATDSTLKVRTGDGSLFPTPGLDEYFHLTLIEYDAGGSEVDWEIIKVTGKTTDTLTIERAQEGTTAQMWLSGTRVENRFTAGTAAAYAWDADISTVGKTNDYNDLSNKPDLSSFEDVVFAASTTGFPGTGDQNVLYIAKDTGYLFRWNSTAYVQLKDQSAVWGQISGTLANQTDLQNRLDLKIENILGESTTDLDEGTNLYFTNARAISAIKGDAAWKAINWDTAYGWGDWSTGVTKTFVDNLNVDADTVDGQHAGAFALSSHTHNYDNYSSWSLHRNGTLVRNVLSGTAIDFVGGTNVSIAWDGVNNKLTFSSTDTNTTYSGGAGISLSGTTFNLNPANLTWTAPVGTDELVFNNAGVPARYDFDDIPLSIFDNDAGFTSNIGDITNVIAGHGLSGGGSSGSVSLTLSTAELSYSAPTGTDEIVFNDAGTPRRYDFDNIPLSIFSNDLTLSDFNNDAGFVTSDTNNYVSSASFSGATLSLGRSGLTTLSATMSAATSIASGVVSTNNQTWGGTKTATNFVASSDERLKKNIISIDSTDLFNRIISLQPRLYTWKSNGEEDMGLIAQEVENFFPEYVHTSEQTGYKAVNYAKLTTALIGAVKELTERVKALEEAS